ncbi:hypothetical protein HYV31_03245 [candidate division WWE3 bacterium]|nr:hypothetical protein [candidate division WWE3 bacterium]
MEKKLLIIDTFNFLHRAYHALPKTFRDENGAPTNAVYGVTSMLINIFDQIKPTYVFAALDSIEPTFRVEDFTGYKAHRHPMEDDLASQIPKVLEIIDAFGVKKIQVNGYEADDLIGTVARKFENEVKVILVSNDRDLWQLVDENITVMVPSKGDLVEWVGPPEVSIRMGIKPIQIIDYKALRGDPSDNIPGVYGIGEKTALKLINEFGSVEEIYRKIALVEPKSLQEKLANNAEEAVMSKHLATIKIDVPMQLNLDDFKYTEINKLAVKEVLERYNFKSLIRRMGFEVKDKKEPTIVDDSQLQLL